MRAIAVDDEVMMLETLVEAITPCADISHVASFTSCSAALAYAEQNPVDVAFLDIHMRGLGGLGLAEKLTRLHPGCKIVFCTGYEEYAVSAFRLHASGYLMKPITPEAIRRELNHMKGIRSAAPLLTVKCFGNFEVLAQGQRLPLRRTKTLELLAYLIDRKGAGVSAKQICAVLWEDEGGEEWKNQKYLYQLFSDLKSALEAVDASEVLTKNGVQYALDTGRIDCDYYSYLLNGKPKFYGEYMSQYSWAETTCALLSFHSQT